MLASLMVESLGGRGSLESAAKSADNFRMEILGHIRNGVVVLEEGKTLPEGTPVSVSPLLPIPPAAQPTETQLVLEPGKLPYVRGGRPGTWNLTNETIAQILEEEDAETMKGMWNVPS